MFINLLEASLRNVEKSEKANVWFGEHLQLSSIKLRALKMYIISIE